jgi:hypothetical protein
MYYHDAAGTLVNLPVSGSEVLDGFIGLLPVIIQIGD